MTKKLNSGVRLERIETGSLLDQVIDTLLGWLFNLFGLTGLTGVKTFEHVKFFSTDKETLRRFLWKAVEEELPIYEILALGEFKNVIEIMWGMSEKDQRNFRISRQFVLWHETIKAGGGRTKKELVIDVPFTKASEGQNPVPEEGPAAKTPEPPAVVKPSKRSAPQEKVPGLEIKGPKFKPEEPPSSPLAPDSEPVSEDTPKGDPSSPDTPPAPESNEDGSPPPGDA